MSSTFPTTLFPEELADIESHDSANTKYEKSFTNWGLPLPPTLEDRAATVSYLLQGTAERDKLKDRLNWFRLFVGRWVFPGGVFGRGKAKIVIPFTNFELLQSARADKKMTTDHLMFVVHHRHMEFTIRGADCCFWTSRNN